MYVVMKKRAGKKLRTRKTLTKTLTMGDKRRYLLILLVVLLTSVASFAILSTQKPERVNEKELEGYVKAYLKKYKEIVEDNFNLVHDIEHVFFKYNNNPRARPILSPWYSVAPLLSIYEDHQDRFKDAYSV